MWWFWFNHFFSLLYRMKHFMDSSPVNNRYLSLYRFASLSYIFYNLFHIKYVFWYRPLLWLALLHYINLLYLLCVSPLFDKGYAFILMVTWQEITLEKYFCKPALIWIMILDLLTQKIVLVLINLLNLLINRFHLYLLWHYLLDFFIFSNLLLLTTFFKTSLSWRCISMTFYTFDRRVYVNFLDTFTKTFNTVTLEVEDQAFQ